MDWQEIYTDIEDKLLPHYECDIWERGLYYHLLGRTRIRGLESATVPLPQISDALRCSDFQSRKTIRSLAGKGCIELEPTRLGHLVKVYLPSELPLPERSIEPIPVDIETIDFYEGRKYLSAILKREGSRCFYCLRKVDEKSCELDHVESQLNGGGNSYRNIVASCHQCNTKKQAGKAEDHIRYLRREELLNDEDFKGRLQALDALRDGRLRPQTQLIPKKAPQVDNRLAPLSQLATDLR